VPQGQGGEVPPPVDDSIAIELSNLLLGHHSR
jgi:hypothetical protein